MIVVVCAKNGDTCGKMVGLKCHEQPSLLHQSSVSMDLEVGIDQGVMAFSSRPKCRIR